MNIHQQHLLELLKEVDAFCKKHSITYYCAGGTVIGAARHHGFIPWDDDIDIYMTRNEFGRFADALNKYGPKDRKLEYYEADNDRRAPVPRYHRDTDTLFCHFHLIGRSCAGTSIDVFILDPIPDGRDARIDYIAKLYAYSDLIAPCHVYSHRLPIEKYDVYDRYKKTADEQGVPEAIRQISDEIFCYDESECSDYCLRWGSVPLIYPIEVIGEPSYLPFEGVMIPVPHDWYRYLVIHYDMDWADLPYEEVQHEHVNILRYDMRYDYFYEKRDELLSQEELLEKHFKWKETERRFYRTAEPIDTFVKDIRDRICMAEVGKRLKKNGADSIKELFDSGEYGAITDIYAPYLELQLSHAYMGRRMRHGTQFRWLFPYVIPMPEDDISMLLSALLRTGKQRDVEKIAGVYRRAGIESAAVEEAAEVIDVINTARRAYYLGEYEEAAKTIKAASDVEKIPALRDVLWLATVQAGITDDEADKLRAEAEATGVGYAVRKAWGDWLWKQGKVYDAEKEYRDLMKNCRNGLFWLDIQSKVPDIAPIPTKKLTPFTETALTLRQRELLEEINAICRQNDIKYVVGPDLARRMHLTGNIGYVNANREIFMDAKNASKFMDAFRIAGRTDRKLMSWSSGDRVRDFALIYSDTDNVYCDFRRLDQWRDMGIFITIRILRSNNASDSYKRSALLDEFTLNLINLEQIDRRNLQSTGKKLAYARTRLMSAGRREDFGRRLFERSIAEETAAEAPGKGGFYYYTNIRGMKPAKNKFARNMWDDTCEAEMSGVSYTIPAAMIAKYVPHETDLANVPPIDSIFIYRSSEMSWDEISPLIDDKRYMALDWDMYAATRRKFRKLSDEVWHDWWMVLKLGEELDLNEAAEKTVKAYNAAVEAGDEAAAADAMASVDTTVRKYEALGVPIDLEPALKECYEDYLQRND